MNSSSISRAVAVMLAMTAMGAHAQALFEEARSRYGDEAAELHVVKLLEERVGLLLRPPHGQPTS